MTKTKQINLPSLEGRDRGRVKRLFKSSLKKFREIF